MASSKRRTAFTRYLEAIIDDTNDLVDDLIDRARRFDEDCRDKSDTASDGDDGAEDVPTSEELDELRASLARLSDAVNRLSEDPRIPSPGG